VIKVNVRGQEMANVNGLKPKLPHTLDDGIEDRRRAAVHQEQFLGPAFDKGDTNDIRSSEVECVDEMNHPEH
jgi:hypothetical protein